MIPYGAEPILKARRSGFKPKDLIIVSLLNRLETEQNPVVKVAKGKTYEWGWCRGLELCFFVSTEHFDEKQILDAWVAKPKNIFMYDYPTESLFRTYRLPVDIESKPFEWHIEVLQVSPWEESQFRKGATWN